MNTQTIAVFGEVLFDCFPSGERLLGGAPFNVAWHLQALGQATQFISRIGQDAQGLAIREAMLSWGMDVSGLQSDAGHVTGTVQVSFEQDQPRYAILSEQAYDFIDAGQLKQGDYGVIYHGTLALRHHVSAQALQSLKARQQTKVFIDVNLRAPWWQKTAIESYLPQAHCLKLNDEELQHWQQTGETLKQTMQRLLSDYALEVLIVTRGAQGAIALPALGDFIEIMPSDGIEVIDTVGAGDAFAAVLLLGMQQGWSLTMTMQRAQDFASAVVGHRGALLYDKAFYANFCKLWAL